MSALLDAQDEHGNDLNLHFSGLDAINEGREPSKEELAAMHTYTPLCAHLAQLAGFDSIEELDECIERVWTAGGRA